MLWLSTSSFLCFFADSPGWICDLQRAPTCTASLLAEGGGAPNCLLVHFVYYYWIKMHRDKCLTFEFFNTSHQLPMHISNRTFQREPAQNTEHLCSPLLLVENWGDSCFQPHFPLSDFFWHERHCSLFLAHINSTNPQLKWDKNKTKLCRLKLLPVLFFFIHVQYFINFRSFCCYIWFASSSLSSLP